MAGDDTHIIIPNTTEPAKPLTIVNIHNSIKLTSTNYISWKLQIEAILIGYDLYKFINGTQTIPPEQITTNNLPTLNPAYQTWFRQDKLVFGTLVGTLTPSIIPLITTAKTSQDIWDVLANTYARPTRGHIKQLKDQIKYMEKGSQSITDYMHSVKTRADALAVLGKPMDIEDLTEKILDGLDDNYKPIVDIINGRDTPISFDELHEKLINKELSLNANQSVATSMPATANAANARFKSGNTGYRGHRPTWGSNSSTNTGVTSPNNRFPSSNNTGVTSPNYRLPSRPYLGRCQWCRNQGHTVPQCPVFRQQQSNITAPSPPRRSPPWQPRPPAPWQPQANLATNGILNTPRWLLDSGASHHVTNDLNNLSNHTPYDGYDDIVIGDGTGLPITHTGSKSLTTLSNTFDLNNVLYVPTMHKNLISISKFCHSNNTSIEFLPNSFFVKDLRTGAILLQGRTKDGVYEWPSSHEQSSPPVALSSTRTMSSAWHHRLGHPSTSILKHIISNFQLDVSPSSIFNFNCNSCQCNKSHKLPFSVTSLVSTSPLEIIFSDVWTSPLHSIDKFKYYVIFVDHFTKYIWLYPLSRKSQVQEVFTKFKPLVENFFNKPIKTFYSDNGGEYLALKSYLSLHGISHLTTPPHTPEHNGFSERRHRHIVETGLSLLTHASMPLSYWTYAFSAAVYLINRLPTPTLNLDSPYAKLFSHSPNYSKLRSFGCLCYPWLRPYASHKLTPRSTPCVFLGYSLTQSAYLCLDPHTSRLYTSRHVKFVEHTYPFTSLHIQLDRPSTTTLGLWTSNVTIPSVTRTPSMEPASDSSARSDTTDLETSTLPASLTNPLAPSIPDTHISSALTSSSNMPSPAVTSLPPTNSPNTASPTSPPTLPNNRPNIVPPRIIITRSKNNIHKPVTKLNLTAQLSQSPETEPTSVSQALKNPQWRQAMSEEYDALVRNGTWELVPSTAQQNLIGCKWIFRTKFMSDGSIDRYKARLVAKGFHQRPGIDYHDTFSPVVKPTTIRLVLSLAVSRGWSLRQLDVNNAFLQGTLSENVYMAQPPGFIDRDKPHHVCRLRKAIYGLKQAPRAWYHELRQFLLQSAFTNSTADSSLFICNSGNIHLYLLVYVDDIVITGNNDTAVQKFIKVLAHRFSLKDLGTLSYFLGVEVQTHSQGLLLSQRRYVQNLLQRTNMLDAKPVATPIATNSVLTLHSGTSLSDPTEYRMVIGSLQYLTLTRPDIAFSVNKLSQFMHCPTTDHWHAAKRLLRYLCGTMDHGITIYRNSPLSLHAFSDADWAGNKDDYTSTGAHIVYLGRNPISWSSKKQRTVARSSTEAEYRSVATTAAELTWILSLLKELGVTTLQQPTIYCDNVGAMHLCSNPVFHSRMKHVALDYHFIREQVQSGLLRVNHVSSMDQLADALTKPLSRTRFLFLKSKIGLSSRSSILRGHDRDNPT